MSRAYSAEEATRMWEASEDGLRAWRSSGAARADHVHFYPSLVPGPQRCVACGKANGLLAWLDDLSPTDRAAFYDSQLDAKQVVRPSHAATCASSSRSGAPRFGVGALVSALIVALGAVVSWALHLL